ncbi:MarR family transcriptional regulator [Paenibacillus sp. LMG 31461]|uniref:MarR family transcriptional regulator n=1 Tax=Paenibacillus plantarum TaxID=2654975 RepID=A0ABX1XKY2_9BACL|nr:MarR family transcriptional regulator [Paenibacillus plantarum]NOU69077.1 MarR family transcriptional regulator [Paenibacillus plantarum]
MTHPLQSHLGYWIKQIYRDFNLLYDQKLAVYGLTASQVNVLEILWTFGDGLTQKVLHEKLKIRPASLTNLIDTLVAGGWVLRKSDDLDARVKHVYLTESGHAHRAICIAMITELEQHLRQSLAPEEASLLLVWMKKIHAHLPKDS